jgi:hypothetical protein
MGLPITFDRSGLKIWSSVESLPEITALDALQELALHVVEHWT